MIYEIGDKVLYQIYSKVTILGRKKYLHRYQYQIEVSGDKIWVEGFDLKKPLRDAIFFSVGQHAIYIKENNEFLVRILKIEKDDWEIKYWISFNYSLVDETCLRKLKPGELKKKLREIQEEREAERRRIEAEKYAKAKIMTVKMLIKELKKYDPNLIVNIASSEFTGQIDHIETSTDALYIEADF